jgi:hypothetical protein
MPEPLTDEYLAQCLADANRFMAQWTGTSGTLAAHVRRLLWEIERLKVAAAQREERSPEWLRQKD